MGILHTVLAVNTKPWDVLWGWHLRNLQCWRCFSFCWPFCVARTMLLAQIVFGFQVNLRPFCFQCPKKACLGRVSFTLASRNAEMEQYWLFWHACCLASKTTGTHVSLGSPFCRQLNPSCCQEVCLLVCVGCVGCFFWSALFSVFLATFQHVAPFSSFLSVKVLSFLGKAS